jgi:predicted metalloprotease with PDZ domain
LWCAERIQVQALRKPDYTKPFVSGTIWLNEGATEYMAHVILYHAGLLTDNEFYMALAKKNYDINTKIKAATRKSQIEASRGWVNASVNDFMEINTSIYDRGAVNNFAADLLIHAKTDGKKGFVDVLRYLMWEYENKNRGFGEDELESIFTKASGVDFSDFFAKYINGKQLPDLDEFLEPYGLKINRTAKGKPAMGGFRDIAEPTEAQLKLRVAFFSTPK